MKTVLVSKFDLKFPADCGITQVTLQLPSVASPKYLPALFRSLRAARSANAVFASNPRFHEFLFMFLARLLCGARLQLLVFDLIMHAPTSLIERLKDLPKIWLLRAVDWFAFIHRDTSA